MLVDMWSVGCIITELVSRAPLFRGENQLDQLSHIISVLGLPPYDWLVRIGSHLHIDYYESGRHGHRRREIGPKDVSKSRKIFSPEEQFTNRRFIR
jgi:serine/threonine protein kinase